ncbi:MAG TPA: calcium-binding protein [Rhodothermales bacterium]|nr:calcium-binding protein [Rhodothermales bacterium]
MPVNWEYLYGYRFDTAYFRAHYMTGREINATDAAQTITATDGNDLIRARGGHDLVYAKRGNDWVDGGQGDDRLYGNYGHDFMQGGDGNDKLYGEADNDQLDGGAGNDIIDGGVGHDELWTWTGRDTVYGGDGEDTIWGSFGNDYLYGGPGYDYVFNWEGNTGEVDYIYLDRDGGYVSTGGSKEIIHHRDGDASIYSGSSGPDEFHFHGTAGGLHIEGATTGSKIVLRDVYVNGNEINSLTEMKQMIKDGRITFNTTGHWATDEHGYNYYDTWGFIDFGGRSITFYQTNFSLASVDSLNASEWGFA